MTSRERVVTALAHKEPDRPPFDCTMTIDTYNNLIEYLGLNIGAAKNCTLFSTVKIDPAVIEAMKLDFAYIGLSPSNIHPSFHYGVDSYTDQWGLVYKKMRQPNGIVNYQVINAPLEDAGISDLENYPWPDPSDDSIFADLEKEGELLYKNTDLALIGNFGGSLFTLASLLRGMEQWYVDLMVNTDFVKKLLERLIEYFNKVYRRCLEIIGKYLMIIRIDNDDYGTQDGLLISLETFRTVLKPQISDFYFQVKESFQKLNPLGKLMKHSCGDIVDILPDFINMGIDIIDPVQVSSRGMRIERLKCEFGNKLSFHGGIDTQHLLPFCTYEEVRNEVKRTSDVLGKNGGYIVCPVHHVEGDVPPENLVAIRDQIVSA